MNKVPMTKTGAEKLKEELQRLKTVERPKIIKAIAEARAHGDLKENAEYHAAKEQQSFIEGRILELEGKLAHAHIIDPITLQHQTKIVFGATVRLINIDTDEILTYQIVGEDEADLRSGKISVSSPIARGLIGKELGDTAAIQAPAGLIEYEIDAIEYK